MCCKGLLKRFLPFAATLMLGVFVAGLFGSVFSTGFNRFSRGERCRGLRAEYEKVKAENERLKSELELRDDSVTYVAPVADPFGVEAPMPPPPPMPPAAPRAAR